MPTPEQPTTTEPEALAGMPDTPTSEQHEQRYKTIAVRVEEQLHTQLQFISDLASTSLSEEVRRAIQNRIESAQDDPALIERAQHVREQIEREAAARTAAIAGFMGHTATDAVVEKPTATTRPQRSRSNAKHGE
jgi:hypothetical protein